MTREEAVQRFRKARAEWWYWACRNDPAGELYPGNTNVNAEFLTVVKGAPRRPATPEEWVEEAEWTAQREREMFETLRERKIRHRERIFNETRKAL